jgi:signal recognition particle receptor subunit beta
MAHVNLHRPNIRFKIVYYGPNLGGRTTNIEELHNLFGGNVEFVSLPTGGGRTMFIDYMPLDLGKLGNMETVFRLYTVPGQDCDNETRKMVLNDVDGIVFVADSQKDAMPNNVESLFDLEEHLAQEGVKLSTLPMVIQYNKRDLDNIASIEQMEAELNQTGRPFFAASALNGENVKKTLLAIAQQVYVMATVGWGFGGPVGIMVVGVYNWLRFSDPPPSPPA